MGLRLPRRAGHECHAGVQPVLAGSHEAGAAASEEFRKQVLQVFVDTLEGVLETGSSVPIDPPDGVSQGRQRGIEILALRIPVSAFSLRPLLVLVYRRQVDRPQSRSPRFNPRQRLDPDGFRRVARQVSLRFPLDRFRSPPVGFARCPGSPPAFRARRGLPRDGPVPDSTLASASIRFAVAALSSASILSIFRCSSARSASSCSRSRAFSPQRIPLVRYRGLDIGDWPYEVQS